MKYLLLLLLLVPGNVACASTVPFEADVIRDVVGQKPSGAACRCEAVCQ
jgi:hypothetical protein